MTTLSEQDFRVKSDESLERARRALLPLADEAGFEIELSNGVLNLLFEEPTEARFVVSPNAPVRQIWVSAHSKSFKLDWDEAQEAFVLPLAGFTPCIFPPVRLTGYDPRLRTLSKDTQLTSLTLPNLIGISKLLSLVCNLPNAIRCQITERCGLKAARALRRSRT